VKSVVRAGLEQGEWAPDVPLMTSVPAMGVAALVGANAAGKRATDTAVPCSRVISRRLVWEPISERGSAAPGVVLSAQMDAPARWPMRCAPS